MTRPAPPAPALSNDTLTALFTAQRHAFARDPDPDRATRLDRLRRLEDSLLRHRQALTRAINADFSHRSAEECRLLDLTPSLGEIRFARRNLKRWMRSRRVSVPLHLRPARARIVPQPLGVVGVISPWNFPVFLSLPPIATALAAGNRVMLKPSELSPQTSDLLAQMMTDAFDPEEVTVCPGGPELAQAFSALPFDHLLFTGSTAVGRKVAEAAARNLTPVTLELGGKSPAIVAPSADLERAARRIAWGKTAFAGQVCVAPDYALVPRAQMKPFADKLIEAFARYYPAGTGSPDLSAIISDRHLTRLQAMIDQARAAGAEVRHLPGAAPDTVQANARKLAPTLILDPPEDLDVMQEELFGPILPIIPYDTQDEALSFVTRRDRPLALYVFAEDRADQDLWMHKTISGGACVNEVVLHVGCDTLPFGGVGPSGQGAYHGDRGFETFSHLKSVLIQPRLNGAALLAPPFTRTKRLLIRLLDRLV